VGYRRSFYQVIVAGQDVTSRFDPLLIEISVSDKVGATSDTCSIELADVDGSIMLPEKGAEILVSMGTDDGLGEVFRGTVDEVRCGGSKKGGRQLTISGKGIDTTKKVKEPRQKHKDNAKFGEVAKEWGTAAGVQISVHESLASIQRDYWDMRGESFINWGRRIADDIGASFKVSGDRGAFVPANEGSTASGQEAPTIRAAWEENLMTWDIAPVVGRPQFKKAAVRYYDTKEGKWKQEDVEITADGVTAEQTVRFSDSTKDQATTKAKSEKGKSERKGAEGSVSILGNPSAKAGGKCIVSGVRPGVDGTYRIKTATHKLSKGSGYSTSLDLDQPQGEAGKDSRSRPLG
jgi:uncharacterized protein